MDPQLLSIPMKQTDCWKHNIEIHNDSLLRFRVPDGLYVFNDK